MRTEPENTALNTLDPARLYQESLEAIQLRDDFLFIASHELKTSLTTLSMQVQLINHLAQDPILFRSSQEKISHIIRNSIHQLNRFSALVNDLMDVSKINSGKFSLNIEETDLSQLVASVIMSFSAEIEKNECHLDKKIVETLLGKWDRLRLEQVIINLLSNAMKYGAGKRIEVRVNGDSRFARLEVIDEGIGISKEDQSRIFKKFERASAVQGYRGLGLGLYISRKIVEAHGGKIGVESNLGSGSTFWVELPV